MRRALVVVMYGLSFLTFVVGVGAQQLTSQPSTSQSKSLPPELRRLQGTLANPQIICIVGEPGAKLAALYLLKSTNTTDHRLTKAIAHLFLLDEQSRDFMRISKPLGTVEKGSQIEAQWQLEANTTIGARWQRDQRTHSTVRERAHYGSKPSLLVFISSAEGTYEVDSSEVSFCFSLPNGNCEETSSTLVGGSIRAPFEKAGVDLPSQ